MCACSKEDSSASDLVFKAVEETLQKSPFSFQGARILSGQEEGAFGWVTVNYLDDRLKQVCTRTEHLHMQVCPLSDVLCVRQSARSRCAPTSMPFCLHCRAWKPQARLILVGPPLRLALYPIIMTALSHPAMP